MRFPKLPIFFGRDYRHLHQQRTGVKERPDQTLCGSRAGHDAELPEEDLRCLQPGVMMPGSGQLKPLAAEVHRRNSFKVSPPSIVSTGPGLRTREAMSRRCRELPGDFKNWSRQLRSAHLHIAGNYLAVLHLTRFREAESGVEAPGREVVWGVGESDVDAALLAEPV